jgi:hypothetical protein
MTNTASPSLQQTLLGNQIKGDETDGRCKIYWVMRNAHKCLVEEDKTLSWEMWN